jgi:hypothetical protein
MTANANIAMPKSLEKKYTPVLNAVIKHIHMENTTTQEEDYFAMVVWKTEMKMEYRLKTNNLKIQ